MGLGVGMTFVLIPAGTFLMGSTTSPEKLEKLFGTDASTDYWAEQPPHRVTISRPFWMSKHLVTQQQWVAVAGANPSEFKGNPKNPVDSLDWYDATAFLNGLSWNLGKSLRLPTEAEWEYACRAGTATEFYFGDEAARLADFAWVGPDSTAPVGTKKPNAWGLHDMAGNLWELCSDWFKPYEATAQIDPKGPPSGTIRVMRGGAWGAVPRCFRSACRLPSPIEFRSSAAGLRVLLDRGGAEGPKVAAKEAKADPGEALFEGDNIHGWKAVGQGRLPAVSEEGQILIRAQQGVGGIVWQKAFPRTNYEISLEAMRIAGQFDFCGVVFPIGDQSVEWASAWGLGGNQVLLSLVNGGVFPLEEAARTIQVQNGRWYHIRIRVTEDRVTGWLDGVKRVDVPRAGTRFTLDENQVRLRPFGISTWYTEAAVRNLRLRRIQPGDPEPDPAEAPKPPGKDLKTGAWEPLFDGMTLSGWKTVGPGQAPAVAEDGRVLLRAGAGQAGMVWQGAFPKTSYELTLEAMRIAGPFDFCDIVFPVGGQCAGWMMGTSVTGNCALLYSFNGGSVPSGEAARVDFQNGRWYRIRIRVTEDRVEGWMDDVKKFDVPRAGANFSTEERVNFLRPFGIGTRDAQGAVRNLQLRRLQPGKEAEGPKQGK